MHNAEVRAPAPSWSGFSPDFVALLAIPGLTLVAYAHAVSSFYIFADEAWVFGSGTARDGLLHQVRTGAAAWGRPLHFAVQWLQSVTVDRDLDLLILNRVLSLAGVAVLSGLVYAALPRRELGAKGQAWLPLAAALFLVVTPAAQIHAVFSVLLGPLLAMILAFVSYRWLDRPWGWLATALALMICMLTYQPSAFFILVAFAADAWRQHERSQRSPRAFLKQRALVVIVLLFGIALVYSAGFKLLSPAEDQLYDGAAPFSAAMDGDLGPFLMLLVQAAGALNLFALWSYPPYVPQLGHSHWALYVLAFAAIVALNLVALYASPGREEGERRTWVILAFAIAFVASLPPILIDGFSARQDLYYPSQAILIIDIAFALSCLPSRSSRPGAAPMITAIVLAVQVFFASISVWTSIIRPQLLVVDFIAARLLAAGYPQGTQLSIAVTIGDTQAPCRYEPCVAYYGRRLSRDFDVTTPGLYERVAQRFGYEIKAFGHVRKPADPRTLRLPEPLVIVDIDELRALYATDRVQM